MGHFASSKNIVCNFISSLPCLTHKKTFTINANIRMYRNDHLEMYKITL